MLRGVSGRFETAFEARPFRIGFDQPSKQYSRGMGVAQRAVRILVRDAEVFAAIGEFAMADQ